MKIDQKENLCNTMRTGFMASAKQIAWRKKFAKKYAKKGKRGKSTKAKSSKPKIEKKGFPDDDWFKEYKRLGGKKTRKQYEKNVDIFVYHTHDIFIHGDASKYKNRGEALEAVKKEAKIDNKELNKLFDSISNITAWT